MAAPLLVDTTIWVDVFARPESSFADDVRRLLGGPVGLVTTGVVIQEVLQGIRRPRDVARVSVLLRGLPYLTVTRDTHVRAAALYRKLRAAGVTGHTVDVLLSQVALDHGAHIWSRDAHFEQIATACSLKLYRR